MCKYSVAPPGVTARGESTTPQTQKSRIMYSECVAFQPAEEIALSAIYCATPSFQYNLYQARGAFVFDFAVHSLARTHLLGREK
eukprot:1306068-Rhodomonas_salina.2